MPIFFKDIASKGIDSAISTANWGFANSAASLILAILAPILGTIADYRFLKKRFFMFFAGIGMTFTLFMTGIGEGQWMMCLMIFIVARTGWAGANLFYDAFIVDVTDKDRMDWVSAAGYAWGYIGGAFPFVIVIALLVLGTASGAPSIPVLQSKIGFVIVACWWLLFTIPIVKNVEQRYFIEPNSRLIQQSMVRLYRTFAEIREHKNAFVFLIAYFFYIDGVDTIITMATAYGREIGLGIPVLILAILMIQIVAFPFALLYGKMAGRFTAKRMLYAGIFVYTVITLIGFFLPVIRSGQLKVMIFFLLAFLVATSMGGIQALSRSFFGKLIPVERSAEFFGFYNIFGKFATIIGPFLMGVIGRLSGDTRYGVLSILVLFIIGGVLLTRVSNP
jgi:MFS transporter, UMF1 family